MRCFLVVCPAHDPFDKMFKNFVWQSSHYVDYSGRSFLTELCPLWYLESKVLQENFGSLMGIVSNLQVMQFRDWTSHWWHEKLSALGLLSTSGASQNEACVPWLLLILSVVCRRILWAPSAPQARDSWRLNKRFFPLLREVDCTAFPNQYMRWKRWLKGRIFFVCVQSLGLQS